MKLYYHNDHVVRFKNGDIWHFFSQKGRGIYLRCMKKNGDWGNAIDLVPNAKGHFSVTIDCRDHLHLIYQGYDGEIVYMEHNGNRWNKQLLHRFEPSSYEVQFPTIIAFNQQVHAIFAIGTIPSDEMWSLYHCYNKGNGWIKGEIITYKNGKQPCPFYLDHDRQSLHLVYRSLYQDQYRLYYCYFDGLRGRWSIPESLSRNISDFNTPSILVKNDRLHLAWTSINNSNLQVMYRNWPINPYFKVGPERERLLSDRESNCSDPMLFWMDDRLWCMWYQNSDIYCCSSPDGGATWDAAKPLGWSHINSCYCIKYSSNHPQDHSLLKMHRTLASLDDGFKILIPATGSLFDGARAAMMDQSRIKHSPQSQRMDSISVTIQNNSSPTSFQKPPKKGLGQDMALSPQATYHEVNRPEPSDSLDDPPAAPINRAIRDLDAVPHSANKKDGSSLSRTRQPDGHLDISIKPVNMKREQGHTYEKSKRQIIDRTLFDNTLNQVITLIQEMNRVNDLKTRVETLLAKNQPVRDSTYYLYQLDAILNSYIKKAEEIQAENQAIMREIDALRRRSIENKRQWEIFVEQFEAIKELLEKNLRTGFIRKIMG